MVNEIKKAYINVWIRENFNCLILNANGGALLLKKRIRVYNYTFLNCFVQHYGLWYWSCIVSG